MPALTNSVFSFIAVTLSTSVSYAEGVRKVSFRTLCLERVVGIENHGLFAEELRRLGVCDSVISADAREQLFIPFPGGGRVGQRSGRHHAGESWEEEH